MPSGTQSTSTSRPSLVDRPDWAKASPRPKTKLAAKPTLALVLDRAEGSEHETDWSRFDRDAKGRHIRLSEDRSSAINNERHEDSATVRANLVAPTGRAYATVRVDRGEVTIGVLTDRFTAWDEDMGDNPWIWCYDHYGDVYHNECKCIRQIEENPHNTKNACAAAGCTWVDFDGISRARNRPPARAQTR